MSRINPKLLKNQDGVVGKWLMYEHGDHGMKNVYFLKIGLQKDIGRYIRENIEELWHFFKRFQNHDFDNGGKIYRKMEDQKKIKSRKTAVNVLTPIFEKLSDEEIVDELWGSNESCYMGVQIIGKY